MTRFQKTDICRHAVQAIAESKIKRVYIVGRRGPLQAAFTIKEFRELIKLPDVAGEVLPEHVQGINIQGEEICTINRDAFLTCFVQHNIIS